MKNTIRLILSVWMLSATAVFAQKGVFFSEYGEGTSYNKYLEIYNNTVDSVDLSDYMFVSCSNGCSVEGQFEFNNTSVIAGKKIAAGDVFVIAHPSAEPNILAQADATYQYFSNGDDWMALLWAADSSVVDAIGIAADVDTISGWYVAGVKSATADRTLYRKAHVLTGNQGDWTTSAGTDSANSEWIVGAKPDGTFLSSDFGKHTVEMQREFKAGDLAIVAFRAGANTLDDEFALLTFVDIKEGTQLHITDMKYTENGIAQCEGGLIWTAPAGIKAGDVIKIGNDKATTDTGSISGKDFGLSKSGDQIIIYEGPFFNPNFVTALSMNAWSTSGITSCKGANSLLPKGLTNGTSAISLENAPGNTSGVTVNGLYNGSFAGTLSEIRTRVFEAKYWNGAADDVDQSWPVWNFGTAYGKMGVFFSEYAEGSSSNKYLEVYNGSGADINLKQFGIRTASNGNGWQSNLVRFNGADSILKAGAVYVIGNSQANQTIKDSSDETNAVTFFNGNDARALVYLNGSDTIILDQVCDPNYSGFDDVAGVFEGFKNDGAWIRKSHIEEGNYGNWKMSRGYDSASSEWFFTTGPTATYTPATLKLHNQIPVRNFLSGDLAIVAYRASANTIDDEFALLSFVDIKEGTQIKITDMKYTENGIAQCEGGLIWTAPAGVKAGDVILVGNDKATVDTGSIAGKDFGLSSGGDQIIIYEGPYFNPNFVTALSTNAWSASGITSCKGSNSLLPKGLTNATNAISHEATTGNVSANTANAYYNGSQTGTTAEVKARVFDYKNWNGAASKIDQIWPKWNFFTQTVAPSFRLIAPANSAALTVEENDNTPVAISWEAEENALGYAWKLATATGSLDQPALVIPADNAGKDTTLTLTSGAIDAALAGLSVAKGTKIDLKWTVTAYFITGDSLNADTFHTIAITRKDDTPITYNFKAGDMAVVAYRMNASTPDEFALLTFVDVPAGAQLNFSDDKVASGVQCDGGDLVWTAPAGGIKAGTVIAVLNDNPAVSLGTVSGGSFGLSSGGDQIMIFEGTPDKAQHITALSSNAWSTSVTCTSKSNSELPKNLTNGTNAISHEMTTGNDAGNTVNAYYTGTMEGTFDEIKKLVADYQNWNGAAAGTEAQQWPEWNFTGKAASTSALSAFQFRVFPNPSNGLVHFNKAIQAQVYNVSGVLVEASSTKVDGLDLRHLNAGIYFIKNEYGATQKISIQ